MSVDRVHSELFRHTYTIPFRLPEIGSVSQPSIYSSGSTTQTSRVSLRAYTQLPA